MIGSQTGGALCLPTLKALIGLKRVGLSLGFEGAVGNDLDLVLAL
ncbi:MAG TPA: hypothetical protein VIE69_03030 [Methylophilaceae bacterium]|jgi:hypothetical protein